MMKLRGFLALLSVLATPVVAIFGGGKEVDIKQFPYHAAIRNDRAYVCSAAIINQDFALAAGQCVEFADVRALTVLVGSSDPQALDSEHHVLEIIKPYKGAAPLVKRDCDKNKLPRSDDFALIRVEEPFLWEPKVHPVILASKCVKIKPSMQAAVTGYQVMDPESPEEMTLAYLRVYTMTEKRCSDSYGNKLKHGLFCAGFIDPQLSESDSPSYGDLLTYKGQLAGIVVHEGACEQESKPPVYLDLADHFEYIREKAKLNYTNSCSDDIDFV